MPRAKVLQASRFARQPERMAPLLWCTGENRERVPMPSHLPPLPWPSLPLSPLPEPLDLPSWPLPPLPGPLDLPPL